MVRLHPDRELAHLLHKWRLPHLHPICVAVRRLFENLTELLDFFALAYPGYTPSEAGLSIVVSGNKLSFYSTLNGLEALEDMNAQRHDLPVAAFIVSPVQNPHNGLVISRLTDRTFEKEKVKTQEFLRRFRGCTTEDLYVAYEGKGWRDDELSWWLSSGMKLGIAPEFLNRLVTGNKLGWPGLSGWEPEKLAEYYRDGVSIEYLFHFWERPDRFESMWQNGIPFAYALILDEEAS